MWIFKKIKDKSSVFSTFGAAAILIFLKSETTFFTVILLHTNKQKLSNHSELALGVTTSPPHVLED